MKPASPLGIDNCQEQKYHVTPLLCKYKNNTKETENLLLYKRKTAKDKMDFLD